MKRWIPILAALALAAVLASCSQPATFSIQLGSSSGSVVRGDQVTVQVTVNNASGTVNLSVAGVPSGVTATLADTTLSAGATSTSLDLQVTPAATDGDATVTVNAVDGGNAASATFDLTVTSLSVNGTVVDLFGAGIAGATVAIQGTTDTTDSSGSFTIDGVAVPYDLIVKQTITSSVVAQVFEGLTSETPEVNPYASIVGPSSPPMSATVSGNLSSAVGAGFEAVVCAQSDTIWMTGCDSVAAGATSYSISVGWAAGSSVPYTLHALEVATDSDGFATGYDRYGTASGNVSNGGAPTLDVTWGSTPSSSDITANVNVPAGFGIQDVYGAAALGAMATLPLFDASGSSVTPLPTSFAANVPQLGTGGATLIGGCVPAVHRRRGHDRLEARAQRRQRRHHRLAHATHAHGAGRRCNRHRCRLHPERELGERSDDVHHQHLVAGDHRDDHQRQHHHPRPDVPGHATGPERVVLLAGDRNPDDNHAGGGRRGLDPRLLPDLQRRPERRRIGEHDRRLDHGDADAELHHTLTLTKRDAACCVEAAQAGRLHA